MTDPVLEKLIAMQEQLVTDIAELRQLFQMYIELTQARQRAAPPAPPPRVN